MKINYSGFILKHGDSYYINIPFRFRKKYGLKKNQQVSFTLEVKNEENSIIIDN